MNEITFEDKKATGLRATMSGGKELTIRAKTVVVSAGAIRTPCLLMKSGVEVSFDLECAMHGCDADSPAFQHPMLGKNLRVHPGIICAGFLNKRQTKVRAYSHCQYIASKY